MVLLFLVTVSILWVNSTEYPSVPIMFLVIPVLSFFTIVLLFPPVFYILRIDMGNYYNCLLWLVPLCLLGFSYNHDSINSTFLALVKLPLGLYVYLHMMRVFHFIETKQQPAIGATWFRKGDKDELASRKISSDDIVFNMLYTVIPLACIVVYAWIREVYK